MIYLYGLSDTRPAAGTLETLAGVTGSVDVSETPHGWLIHGPSDGTELLPKRRHLLAHTRVLEVLGETATVLPMRFGMLAESADEIADLVSASAAEIADTFKRLSGQTELGVRIEFQRDAALAATLKDDPALAKTHATLADMTQAPHFEAAAFGRSLAEALDVRRGRAQHQLIEELRPHLTDFVLKTPDSDVQVLGLDVLIPKSFQPAFLEHVTRAADAVGAFAGHTDPSIRIVGPVPPFSFVNLSLSPAEAA